MGNHAVPESPAKGRGRTLGLALAALGVVYGDIGTSPLYTIKECFRPEHGLRPEASPVLGVLSLVFWSLTLVVSVKYLAFVLRADNRGDGGILALVSLLPLAKEREGRNACRTMPLLVALALAGTGLLLADGSITPAISVLGAVEGLEVAVPAFARWVVPLAVVILVGLFAAQRRGTAGIGAVFGPVMILWFTVLAATGIPWILREPSVLTALDPRWAVRFFLQHGMHGFLILGTVVLCITGTEALYADMGHFGRKPIRRAWFALVFPSLLLNYFGQGALLLAEGDRAIGNPFFALVPAPMALPLVVLATVAAVIASQALISGSYSLAQQAMQLGYLPRMTVIHTSADIRGQIYMPQVNAALLAACLALVLAFRETGGLAGAYGLAVMGTMLVTTLLLARVARVRWGWGPWRLVPFTMVFLAIDGSFLLACLGKIRQGGWFPLVAGLSLFTVMVTWKRGREILGRQFSVSMYPIEQLLEELSRETAIRVPGTAVFLTSGSEGTPLVLLHHIKHNKMLHEKVVLMTLTTEIVPRYAGPDRVAVEALGHGFFRVTARYGFMEQPNMARILARCEPLGLKVHPLDASYYLGRLTLVPGGRSPMARWRKALFMFLLRNARPATAYFGIPANRVVELGAQVEF